MKHFLPFIFMFCVIDCFASYLTTRTDGTVFYADPECKRVAESGITKGNTFYYNENSQPASGVVCFEFGGETVYARESDVDTFTDEEFESAGPLPDDYYDDSTPWSVPGWLKWIIAFALIYALYKLAPRLLSRLNANAAALPQPEPLKPEPIVEKYGPASKGCIKEFYNNLDFSERLDKLNRLAAHNPGKNTTDAEALRKYLTELQPALRSFLREASNERQFVSDPRLRGSMAVNAEGEGCNEWLFVQLRTSEYVDPERLRQLDPLKFEVYVSENLSRSLRSDNDRQLLEKRLKTSLSHIDDYDNADRERIYYMLWDLKRKSDPQEAYGYICKAVELGHKPYPKERMEKKYGTSADGRLDMNAYKRKKVLKWICLGVVGAAVIAALLLLAMYVALIAIFAFCLYFTFKMMIDDATNINHKTSSVSSRQQAAAAYTCGSCKHYESPDCPRWGSSVGFTDPSCGMCES